MKDLLELLTQGNAAEVKIVLASVALALAIYQLAVIAVAYGRVRLPFLASGVASTAHRSVGDTIASIVLVVTVMCLVMFGFDAESDAGEIHVVAATAFLAVLMLKIIVVRSGRGGRALPWLGGSVFVLLGATWASSAGILLFAR